MTDLEAGRTLSAAESTSSSQPLAASSKPKLNDVADVFEQQLKVPSSASQHGRSESVSEKGFTTSKHHQPPYPRLTPSGIVSRRRNRLKDPSTYAEFMAKNEEDRMEHISRKSTWVEYGAAGLPVPIGQNDYECGLLFPVLWLSSLWAFI